jgi:undecaprenyl-diphosphatase
MLDTLNRSLLEWMVAPPDASGGALLPSLVLAEWASFTGPAALVLLWVLGDTQDRRAAIGACLSALLALALAAGISSIYFHPRPFMDGLARNYLHHVSDSSFPSDHATVLFALAWSLFFTPSFWLKRLWLTLLLLACAVGWSRIYLGAHYPLDIVGAAVLGLLTAYGVNRSSLNRLRDLGTDLAEKLYNLPLDLISKRKG